MYFRLNCTLHRSCETQKPRTGRKRLWLQQYDYGTGGRQFFRPLAELIVPRNKPPYAAAAYCGGRAVRSWRKSCRRISDDKITVARPKS